MFTLRADQIRLESGIFASWQAGSDRTIGVAPTGAGKTIIMSSIASKVDGPAVAMAHRQELVEQISMAFARMGLPHRIIASDKTIKNIINSHVIELGRSFHDSNSRITVAGVNTLIARYDALVQWGNTVKWWLGDECHHFLGKNQWGQAVDLFKRAKGVGFTATPIRTDRKSLARSQGGVFDDMVIGPTMSELIEAGHLSRYEIKGPPISIDRGALKISKSTGEFQKAGLQHVFDDARSTILGDIVQCYLQFAQGRRGITFVTDIKAAMRTAEAFRAAGVRAEAVDGTTHEAVRSSIIRKFRNGDLDQLVNVDLFGEGFDVPAVEVVSMARPTQSLGLYRQQFGRALRVFEGKSHGIVIDHVGNVEQHLLPDREDNWSLIGENTGRNRRNPDETPVRRCTQPGCWHTYEAITAICPKCGHRPEPASRSDPKHVDGDLIEYGPELLERLRGEIKAADSDAVPVPANLRGTPTEGRLNRQHGQKQLARSELREAIALWAGVRRDRNMGDSEIYRRFFHMFGVDVMSAQAITNLEEIETLTNSIKERYWA